jgi:crotonobetainyl-CoA:carnitine CoA-transferase CaiB-like acyl-CoA transferase
MKRTAGREPQRRPPAAGPAAVSLPERPTEAGARPLAGLRVLDFSHAAAAPFATMFLGDLGAEVIKIEKPRQGDGSRSMGVPIPSLGPKDSDYYVSLNRNKRGMVLDLAHHEGAALARRLAAQCDVVVENFRPQVMPRLGLGFADLAPLRRGLVYCSISAFGTSGPWAERPANDIIMQSVSGLMGITGEVGGAPVRIGAPISDFSSGLFGLTGVLAGLLARERFPAGQHIQVAMLDASLNMMCNYIPGVASLGQQVPRLGRGHAQIVPYQAFECADGEYLMVGAFTREFWWNLCRALNRAVWMQDPRFATNAARLRHRDLLVGELETLFATQPRAHWLAVLEQADVPVSPVLELHEAVRTEQVAHNHALQALNQQGQAIQVAACPVRAAQWGPAPATPAPQLGAHTQEVLQSLLGMGAPEIAALAERQVIGVL